MKWYGSKLDHSECHAAIAGWSKVPRREKKRVDRMYKKYTRQSSKDAIRKEQDEAEKVHKV